MKSSKRLLIQALISFSLNYLSVIWQLSILLIEISSVLVELMRKTLRESKNPLVQLCKLLSMDLLLMSLDLVEISKKFKLALKDLTSLKAALILRVLPSSSEVVLNSSLQKQSAHLMMQS